MSIIQASFLSDCLNRKVHFSAILPVDSFYPNASALPYKTVYLLHGYTGSCDGWFAKYPLRNFSMMNNLAIIMPNAENHFYVDDMQRGDMHGELIGQELVDFTRNVFPLSTAREDTIIGGISMGGSGALRNGLKCSDIFGHIISISPAIVTENIADPGYKSSTPTLTRGFFESVFGDLNGITGSNLDIYWLSQELKRSGVEFPSIYIACGANDRLIYETRRFHAHLNELGIVHDFDEAPGTHDELFFEPHLMRGFDRLDLDRLPVMQNPFWVDSAVGDGNTYHQSNAVL